jgi:hypothetical protein
MAQFDLKKATIYLQDGYSDVGAVNKSGGYSAAASTMVIDGLSENVPVGATFRMSGDDQIYSVESDNKALGTAQVNNAAGYIASSTTMAIDTHTGIIPTGSTFTAVGDAQTYTVTGHTETLGNTTSITFTPGLVNPTVDDQVLTFLGQYTVNITFTPGLVIGTTDNQVITFSGRQLEIKIGEGNLTYDEKRTMEYKKDRGRLDTVREGDQEPIDVRLDIRWDWLSSAGTDTAPTPEEVLKQEGLASDWVSSAADTCEPFSVNIVVVYDPECATEDAEVIHLKDYRYESLNHDLKAGTLATSGKCNVTKAVKERLTLA